jgi:tRNA threonylcarbamoyladenosine biosynthesis protein TsaE
MQRLLLTDSFSDAETMDIAKELTAILMPGDIIALLGPLGTGKTVFVKGLAVGLECQMPVRSPTFSLINEYPGHIPLYHIDFYRLEGQAEIEDLGWTDYLNSDGVVVIEWAERVKNLLPENRFEVYLSFLGLDGRKIEVLAFGDSGNR